jgi:hypothetical protein
MLHEAKILEKYKSDLFFSFLSRVFKIEKSLCEICIIILNLGSKDMLKETTKIVVLKK